MEDSSRSPRCDSNSLVSGFRIARSFNSCWSQPLETTRSSSPKQRKVFCHSNIGTTSARREVARPRERCDYELLETAQRPQKDRERTRPDWKQKTPEYPRSRSHQPAVTNASPFRVTPTRRPYSPPAVVDSLHCARVGPGREFRNAHCAALPSGDLLRTAALRSALRYTLRSVAPFRSRLPTSRPKRTEIGRAHV